MSSLFKLLVIDYIPFSIFDANNNSRLILIMGLEEFLGLNPVYKLSANSIFYYITLLVLSFALNKLFGWDKYLCLLAAILYILYHRYKTTVSSEDSAQTAELRYQHMVDTVYPPVLSINEYKPLMEIIYDLSKYYMLHPVAIKNGIYLTDSFLVQYKLFNEAYDVKNSSCRQIYDKALDLKMRALEEFRSTLYKMDDNEDIRIMLAIVDRLQTELNSLQNSMADKCIILPINIYSTPLPEVATLPTVSVNYALI